MIYIDKEIVDELNESRAILANSIYEAMWRSPLCFSNSDDTSYIGRAVLSVNAVISMLCEQKTELVETSNLHNLKFIKAESKLEESIVSALNYDPGKLRDNFTRVFSNVYHGEEITDLYMRIFAALKTSIVLSGLVETAINIVDDDRTTFCDGAINELKTRVRNINGVCITESNEMQSSVTHSKQ